MGVVLLRGKERGVASVAAHKVAQNSDVFTDIMIASRTESKCKALAKAIEDKGLVPKGSIKTAHVDADNVPELVALFNSYKPDLVMNLALPYQDLTIMEACLQSGVSYLDTANYEPKDEAHFEYFVISTSSIATQATTTRHLPPTSTPKSTSARLPRRASTGKMVNGWRLSRWRFTSH